MATVASVEQMIAKSRVVNFEKILQVIEPT